jgi:hypothetical protein
MSLTAEADSNAKLRIENGKLFDDEADSPKRFPPQAFHFQFSIPNSPTNLPYGLGFCLVKFHRSKRHPQIANPKC